MLVLLCVQRLRRACGIPAPGSVPCRCDRVRPHQYMTARPPGSCMSALLLRHFSGRCPVRAHWIHAPGSMRIDLNADLGEGVTDDEGLLAVVTSANLACGFHAGDEETMRAVCAAPRAAGGDRRAGLLRRPRALRPRGTSTSSRGADRLGGRAGRPADPDRRGVRHRGGVPQAARRALQPGRRRRGPGRGRAAGSGTLPVLGLPGSAILRLAEAGGRTGVARGVPRPRLHRRRPPGSPRPARRAGRGRRRDRRATRWSWPPRCGRCASTATHRERSRQPARCGRRSARRGTTYARGR